MFEKRRAEVPGPARGPGFLSGGRFAAPDLSQTHARLGHISPTLINLMIANNTADGLPRTKMPDIGKCKICIESNLKHADIPNVRTREITRPLEVIGCDLQEIETKSHSGFKYLAIYADHYSGVVMTKPLKSKAEQPRVAIEVINRLERMAGTTIGSVTQPQRTLFGIDTIRADQGGEYTAKQFVDELNRRGIRLEYSDTDQPFQNGLAETMGGKIVKMMLRRTYCVWSSERILG